MWRKQLLAFAQPRNNTITAHSDKTPATEGVEGSTSECTDPNRSSYYTATVTADQHFRQEAGVPYVSSIHSFRPSAPVETRTGAEDQHNVISGANRAAINYCRVAILFFIALCVTWIPSTINRVYSLVYPNNPRFDMNVASGIVLSLQGFWNAVIYISASWPAARRLIRRLTCRGEPDMWGVEGGRLVGPRRPKQQMLLQEAVGNIQHQRGLRRAVTTESEEEMVHLRVADLS